MLDYLLVTVPAEIVGTLVGLAVLAIYAAVVRMYRTGYDVPDELDLGGN